MEKSSLCENAHVKSVEAVIDELKSNITHGLTSSESGSRFILYGPNKLPAQHTTTVLERLWAQINSVLIYILIVGAIISFVFKHLIDGVLICLVVVINILSGYLMESKAENATEVLKSMLSPNAQVVRDGDKKTLEAIGLTVGDIFLLQPGDIVPADGRVIKSVDLSVLESALTGEAHAILKSNAPSAQANAPLAERKCIVYSGTQVLKGTATCIVTAIGADCEIGKISGLLKDIEALKTPLIIQLEKFGLILSVVIICLALATFGIATARGYAVDKALAIAIGIAVAAIPEGLPACITITFAIGVNQMSHRHAIVKSLPAVETLGSVSVICSDKTGTLTINKMTVMTVCTNNETYEFNEDGRVVQVVPSNEKVPGAMISLDSAPRMNSDQILGHLLPGILCNDGSVLMTDTADKDSAEVQRGPSTTDLSIKQDDNKAKRAVELVALAADFTIEGDPTETCVLVLGVQMMSALEVKNIQKLNARVSEIPFDSATKYMATLHRMDQATFAKLQLVIAANNAGNDGAAARSTEIVTPNEDGFVKVVCVKGAPSEVIKFCAPPSSALDTDAADYSEFWSQRVSVVAAKGMRVLAFAFKVVPDDFEFSGHLQAHSGFTLTALVGIVDPPRPEAIVAIQQAHTAGITVKMITGDHPVTALAIGRMMGIPASNRAMDTEEGGASAVTGTELDRLIVESMDAFDEVVVDNNIFARTTPEHKLRIVQSLQRQGFVCSMTGDGVNDAPALKAANIGVAMGITGTEVAKDAANVVLTDDNFATIVEAVRIGRCTYNNLVKIITFVLPTNGGQAFSIISALIIGVEVPITALQVLWVNMITSVLMGLVLAFDKPDSDILTQKPRRANKPLFGRFLTWRLVFVTTVLTVAVLGIYQWERHRISDVDHLRTISVNMLMVAQISYIFNCRNLRHNTSFQETFGGNRVLYAGIGAVGVLHVLFTYAPPLQYVFSTRNLDGTSWGKIILLAVVIFWLVEAEKWIGATRLAKRATRGRRGSYNMVTVVV